MDMDSNTRHQLSYSEREEIGEKVFGLENMKSDNNCFCKPFSL